MGEEFVRQRILALATQQAATEGKGFQGGWNGGGFDGYDGGRRRGGNYYGNQPMMDGGAFMGGAKKPFPQKMMNMMWKSKGQFYKRQPTKFGYFVKQNYHNAVRALNLPARPRGPGTKADNNKYSAMVMQWLVQQYRGQNLAIHPPGHFPKRTKWRQAYRAMAQQSGSYGYYQQPMNQQQQQYNGPYNQAPQGNYNYTV
jgi:hypothetical protein